MDVINRLFRAIFVEFNYHAIKVLRQAKGMQIFVTSINTMIENVFISLHARMRRFSPYYLTI